MSLFSWIFGKSETKCIVCYIPLPMYHAMQTIMYINEEATEEEIIIDALNEYLKKRVWATNEKEHSTAIKRAPTFKRGASQMRG